jgi:Protein of unknown function (DUF3168)
MSYAAAAALQAALFAHLTSAPELADVEIYDAVPPSGTGTFVLIGPEEAKDQSDATGSGAEHRLVISVIADTEGFMAAKTIAVAIADRLNDAALTLARGSLVGLQFLQARAKRSRDGDLRRIDMTFRARVEL